MQLKVFGSNRAGSYDQKTVWRGGEKRYEFHR